VADRGQLRPARTAAVLASALALGAATWGLAGPTPPAAAGPTDLSTSACRWESHSKRVVKRVWRDGRWRRTVRIRRWRTCEPLKPALPPPAGPARISVKAAEFSLILSRPSLPAGEAIVELNNRGEDPHDLDLSPAGSSEVVLDLPEVESLERASSRVTLEPGTYEFYCSLPNHRGLGMEAKLIVQG
jgi:Copper binding proteins, plastocyanin/azurin family